MRMSGRVSGVVVGVVLALAFGLLHGFGFAGALAATLGDQGLAGQNWLVSLFAFNLNNRA